MSEQYRQGDVLIRTSSRPDVANMRRIEPSGGRVVLARGEATGRAHAIAASQAELYRRTLRLHWPLVAPRPR